MLKLLLDEHVSPVVAEQLILRRQELIAVGLPQWEDGRYLGVRDELLLMAASQQNLTLVTYDLRTIVPLLKDWGEQGISHGGVVFVDERTLAPNDFGGLVRTLEALWEAHQELDWTNHVVYLINHWI